MLSRFNLTHKYAFQNFKRYSTGGVKPSLKLVAELRKHTEVSISKAREALAATNNDVLAAVDWLAQDLATSGVKKAAKVADRVANEGLISVSILSNGFGGLAHGTLRAAMVELNCETDFVGRNNLFAKLATDIAHTAAFISEPSQHNQLFQSCSLETLNAAPLVSSTGSSTSALTVKESILDLTSKVGEKVALRKAVFIARDPLPNQPNLGLRITGHAHGLSPSLGRIGALALIGLKSPKLPNLAKDQPFIMDLHRLEKALARQIVGFETLQIKSPPGEINNTSLYDQEFMMMGETLPVGTVLRAWEEKHGLNTDSGSEDGVAVVDFERWTLGKE